MFELSDRVDGCGERAACSKCSDRAVRERRFHRRARLEGAEHLHGGDGGAGEFRRDVAGDAREPENLDMQRRAGVASRLEILRACSATARA